MIIATRTREANSVLRALSTRENRRLLAHSEQVDLTYGDVLCESGKPLRHIYFINSGLVSLLTPVGGHANVEVGLVGNEGVAGLPLFLGIGVSPVRMLVQGSGTATRMKAASFRDELRRNPVLQRALNQYLYAFIAQVSQTAACNRHHLLVKRLARWLLLTHDRAESNVFHLTQEFLAHMLGVRRVGVSGAASLLQSKKLISYSRGNITILNRQGLERAACRCYRDVNAIRDRMLAEAN
jgi:CRP-like cAMP-binding protein